MTIQWGDSLYIQIRIVVITWTALHIGGYIAEQRNRRRAHIYTKRQISSIQERSRTSKSQENLARLMC